MSEFLKSKAIAAGTVILLGCTACTSSEQAGSSDHDKSKTRGHSGTALVTTNVKQRKVEYLSNGSRLLLPYSLPYPDEYDGTDSYDFPAVLQWCEDGGLEQQAAGQEATLTPRFAGCDDGRLTPSDFGHAPAERH